METTSRQRCLAIHFLFLFPLCSLYQTLPSLYIYIIFSPPHPPTLLHSWWQSQHTWARLNKWDDLSTCAKQTGNLHHAGGRQEADKKPSSAAATATHGETERVCVRGKVWSFTSFSGCCRFCNPKLCSASLGTNSHQTPTGGSQTQHSTLRFKSKSGLCWYSSLLKRLTTEFTDFLWMCVCVCVLWCHAAVC